MNCKQIVKVPRFLSQVYSFLTNGIYVWSLVCVWFFCGYCTCLLVCNLWPLIMDTSRTKFILLVTCKTVNFIHHIVLYIYCSSTKQNIILICMNTRECFHINFCLLVVNPVYICEVCVNVFLNCVKLQLNSQNVWIIIFAIISVFVPCNCINNPN